MTQYRFNIESSLSHVCVFRVSRGITRCSHLLVPERIALCSCSWSLLLVQSLLLRRCFCLVQLRPSATVETNQRIPGFFLKDVSRFFKIFHISWLAQDFLSWTEDPVLLESMPVPWLQNSDSRECHKVRIKPHVLQMCPAPKIFCKIDGLAFDECDTTYT